MDSAANKLLIAHRVRHRLPTRQCLVIFRRVRRELEESKESVPIWNSRKRSWTSYSPGRKPNNIIEHPRIAAGRRLQRVSVNLITQSNLLEKTRSIIRRPCVSVNTKCWLFGRAMSPVTWKRNLKSSTAVELLIMIKSLLIKRFPDRLSSLWWSITLNRTFRQIGNPVRIVNPSQV